MDFYNYCNQSLRNETDVEMKLPIVKKNNFFLFCTMFSFFVILIASLGIYKFSSASTEFIVPTYVACTAAMVIFAGAYE